MAFTAEQASAEIIKSATYFLNLRETANNAAWDNPDTAGQDAAAVELRRLLEQVGWQAGWPYCMAFCKAIYYMAYRNLGAEPRVLRLIMQQFTSSVMQTHTNCGRFSQAKVPLPGAIFFMQKGSSELGHAGLVVTPGQASFATIEGNTSPAPGSAAADREGDGVYKKVRTLSFASKPAALWLRSFLNPLGSDDIERLLPIGTAGVRSRRAKRPTRSKPRAKTVPSRRKSERKATTRKVAKRSTTVGFKARKVRSSVARKTKRTPSRSRR